MAQQLNLLSQGQIIPTALHTEMERSYLEYAMSVIVGRALPDVRDGLKPVHRRILYAMYELGLTPDRPFRKCARVVGDVLGKYHPHGDQAVYDAMVRLVQDFSSRYPLLSGHGNFGSVDNDPAAAMRYTESRLSGISYETMLMDVNDSTVDFTSNFDNSNQEPVVLPAKLPILLLNGCSGIAVGMATNIPPHNLNEIVDALIALIDEPDLSNEKLLKLVPGPDFPTSGEIIDQNGIKEAYLTGKGIIPVRGVATIEQLKSHKKRSREKTAIIVTELPFQVNKAAWIEKVAELVNQGKINDIADIRDESDRQGIRVVIELKKDGEPQHILNQLYKQTALQSNFGVIMLGLVNNKPCQLSLKEMLTEFLSFRETTLTRQYNYELIEKQEKVHLLEGLLIALKQLKKVIEILSNSPDGTIAKNSLQERLKISESQANSILSMPLRRITGLEKQKIEEEFTQLQTRITQLQELLGDRKELLKALKKELRSFKRKFGDDRRTKITNKIAISVTPEKQKQSKFPQEELPLLLNQPLPEDAIAQITAKGKIYWQRQNEIDTTPIVKKTTDLIVYQELIGKQEQIIAFFDSGKAYPIPTAEIPPYPAKQTIEKLVSNSAMQDNHQPINYLCLHADTKSSLLLLTKGGFLKRVSIQELDGIGNRGFQLIKLKPQDSLKYILPVNDGEELAVATNGGRLLRYSITEENMSIMGRSAQGSIGIKLKYGEEIVGCLGVNNNSNIALISQLGYAKILPINTIRKVNLGQLGTQAFRFKDKNDRLQSILSIDHSQNIIVKTNLDGRHLIDVNKLTPNGEKSIVKLQSEEIIILALNWFGQLTSS
ncbi:DNA topoisomerase (ATP-hydrolyzing) subunit A [Geminocystis sp. NIES-3709]|uniref:DNA gyrase/topoisomerase IV subunit A n=1 Tax=Geminocystis sp. NIES-3709 TaxID=1617448 RepID=UPI0005FCC444|nr:DNA topoisomerase (ATP-hydrolyzing) [Geminocystis sp. NIES-3709]BAQ65743.1 DNA gyrase subunit A [Geminocystis sp. NIES-3709]